MPELEYDVTKPYLDLIRQYRPKPDETDPEAQRRIAKGNAVAEAFRILVDAVGGSKGANIQERIAPANAVMGAVDKYWKTKEANKAEQQRWDQLEMGTGLKALENESQNRFATQKQKEAQEFTAGQQKAQQEFTASENEKNRISNKQKLAQDAEQFRSELGLKKEIADTSADIDREKIAASLEKQQMMYPYGRDKGMFISDPDVMKQINIPDNKKSQVLAFLGQDPNVKDEISIIKMQYGSIGPEAQSDLLISRLYPKLSPETRQKIREFIGNTQPSGTTTGTQKPGDQFLFYKNTPPPQSQAPSIKTSKSSTMVQVQQPEQQNSITPEQISYMQKIIQAKNYTPEIKRAAVYKYLLEQGYDNTSAKNAAERVYQSLIGN